MIELIRSAKVSVVDVESLRELKTLLRSTLPSDLDLATQAQHRYLLNAGGADVDVIEPAEIHSAGVVCSPASETGLAETVTRNTTEGSAITGSTAAATESRIVRRSGRGGSR
jgi:hypothetical protein